MSELPPFKEMNYDKFTLNEDKKALNKKRYFSPIKVIGPRDNDYLTNSILLLLT